MDVDPEKSDELRFVVAPSPTLASTTLLQVSIAAKTHISSRDAETSAFYRLQLTAPLLHVTISHPVKASGS